MIPPSIGEDVEDIKIWELWCPSAGMLPGMNALKSNLAILSKVDIFGNSAPFLGNSPRDYKYV